MGWLAQTYLRFWPADPSKSSGIRTTCQFNTKVFNLDGTKPHLWCSTPLTEHFFSEDMTGFFANDCALELSEEGDCYAIKSMTDERALVNLKVTRSAPGFANLTAPAQRPDDVAVVGSRRVVLAACWLLVWLLWRSRWEIPSLEEPEVGRPDGEGCAVTEDQFGLRELRSWEWQDLQATQAA